MKKSNIIIKAADDKLKSTKHQRLVTTAVSIASKALVESDPIKLAKITIASNLLALAGTVSGTQSDRLFRVAKSLTTSD